MFFVVLLLTNHALEISLNINIFPYFNKTLRLVMSWLSTNQLQFTPHLHESNNYLYFTQFTPLSFCITVGAPNVRKPGSRA